MAIQKILREPMVHFLLIGACLFAIFSAMNNTDEERSDVIHIQPDMVEQLDFSFERAWMRPPTPQERELLINEYLRDEVFYREAVVLGMVKGDPVIRRRLRQKLELILEDVSNLSPPTDEDLAQYLQENAAKFRQQPKIALRQIYFNPEKHADLDQDIQEALKALDAGADPGLMGDPFLINPGLEPTHLNRIERDFGARFAQNLDSLDVQKWAGPIQSGFGLHLVFVDQRIEGRLPDLTEIRDKVLMEWQLTKKTELEDATFQKLLSKYEVVIDLPRDETANLAGSDQ